MASVPSKITKAIIQEDKELKESIETPTSVITSSLNAPKHGTVIPNRVFVGGISSATTENDLVSLFSNYGSVIGAKIIADRAGVSKGYGFVTFETEDEAKRLQKDADNIILRERRLNIAPAVKKQGYGRVHSYDCPNTPVPIPSPVYRQNGIAYTFHNGMAFFPQPTPQTLPPAHLEPPTVYQQGAPYGTVPQGSQTPTYQYPYSQGQLIYQPHHQYPYHPIQQYEGCYDSQVMMHDANLVLPQYYLAPQDVTFYQPAPMHPQDPNPSLQPQIMYHSPRAYDPAIVYTSEPTIEPPEAPVVQVQEADTSAANSVVTTSATVNATTNNEITTTTNHLSDNAAKRGRETPVVSLLKVYNNKETPQYNNNQKGNGQTSYYQSQGHHQIRRKPRQPEDGRRPQHLNNNNNNPEAANRNLIPYQQQGPQQRGLSRRGSPGEGALSDTSSPQPGYSSSPRPPYVPSYPHYRFPPPTNHLTPFYGQQPSPLAHRSRSFHRPRYGGPGGGRGGGGRHHHQRLEGGKWANGGMKEEAQQPLTPPITPKSESGRAAAPAVQQTSSDDLVKSIQTLAI